MSDYEMSLNDTLKLRWSASVEWFSKMDVPESEHGYYASLNLNGNQVASWKLTNIDMMMVCNNRPNPYHTAPMPDGSVRMVLRIDKAGLAEFIASKVGRVLESLDENGNDL